MKNINKYISEFTYDRYLWVCLLYWMVLMVRLWNRDYLEMGDSFSFIIYAAFIFTFLVILLVRSKYSPEEKKERAFFGFSIIPVAITTVLMCVSLFALF